MMMMTTTTTVGGPQNHQQQFPSSSTSSSSNTNNNVASLGSFLTNNPRLLPPDVDGTTSNSNNNSQQQYHHRQHRRRRIEEEYDPRDLLGTGTCGEVRRATGDERAVKIISIDGRGGGGIGMGGMSSEKLAAIQAEADILLRSLDHPYVVKLFDACISPGKAIYLVMELIRGGDLFDRIVERERYTEVQARRLFRRILAAVYYLHEERGIVHRDLKPENILVVDRRSDVNIKHTDFGLAKNMTAQGLKTFCGTPQVKTSLLCLYFIILSFHEISSCPSLLIHPLHQYFAPEVLRRQHTVKGDGRYGKEIDCWSIGVILFILLSGSPPFDVSAGFDAVANAKVIFHEDQ
jgi:serine/threonine protein kinase